MNIECLNKGYACSTLVIGSFNPNETYEVFCGHLDKQMKRVIESFTGNHKATSYSFVLASTNKQYHKVREHLTLFGFSSTEDSYNKKNCTHVQLHIMSVHDLMDKLKTVEKTAEVDYDDFGTAVT